MSFPVEREPVAGWKSMGPDIGLLPGVGVGALFAAGDSMAFFVTDQGC